MFGQWHIQLFWHHPSSTMDLKNRKQLSVKYLSLKGKLQHLSMKIKKMCVQKKKRGKKTQSQTACLKKWRGNVCSLKDVKERVDYATWNFSTFFVLRWAFSLSLPLKPPVSLNVVRSLLHKHLTNRSLFKDHLEILHSITMPVQLIWMETQHKHFLLTFAKEVMFFGSVWVLACHFL